MQEIENIDYNRKLTIEEVLDTETGEIISSVDFFKQSETILFAHKERQEYAIKGLAKPKFICIYCSQIVKISGKKTERGKVSFFAHLRDSDNCIIKTDNNLSIDEILIGKYQGQKESERHIELKNKIYNALIDNNSKKIGVTNVNIEKTIKSNYPILNWRRPDISAQYQNRNIAFELQLSTTFFSVIIAREIFYSLHETFVIWIFNFSDKHQYTTLESMMCKDIYYANRRNAFIFDTEAQLRTEQEGELILKCVCFEPIVSNNSIVGNKKEEKFIRLTDITFQKNELKAFYIDADKLYFQYDPCQEETRKKLESDKRIWLENFKLKLSLLEQNQNLKYDNVVNSLKENNIFLTRVKKGNKYGYFADSIQIVDYAYSDAGYINEKGIAFIKQNRKYGFINNCGVEIIPCNYIDFLFFVDGIGLVKLNKDWYLINDKNTFLKKFQLHHFNILNSKYIECVAPKEILYGKYGEFVKEYKHGIIDYKGNVIIRPVFNNVSVLKLNNLEEVRVFVESVSFEVMVAYLVYFREFDSNFTSIHYRKKTHKNIFDVSLNDKWGIMDLNGNIIIELLYDLPLRNVNKLYIASKNGLFGLIDNIGKTVIEFNFKSIIVEKDRFKAIDDKYTCYYDLSGNELIDQNNIM